MLSQECPLRPRSCKSSRSRPSAQRGRRAAASRSVSGRVCLCPRFSSSLFFLKNNLEMPLDESLVVDKSIFRGVKRISVGGTGSAPHWCGGEIRWNFEACHAPASPVAPLLWPSCCMLAPRTVASLTFGSQPAARRRWMRPALLPGSPVLSVPRFSSCPNSAAAALHTDGRTGVCGAESLPVEEAGGGPESSPH